MGGSPFSFPTWVENRWLLLDHDQWVAGEPYSHPVVEWPEGTTVASLPRPRFELGQRVGVRANHGMKTGTVEKIWISHWQYPDMLQLQYEVLHPGGHRGRYVESQIEV